jgi:tetratricopeptide (TPR) repeat protein
MSTVSGCAAALDRLYELDERHGGSTIYALATQMVSHIRTTLAQASYPANVGRGLRRVAASTAEHAGWLAFDAGHADEARHWWLEALHFADLAESNDARVTALASMALQACTSANPSEGREAIDLMGVAKRSASATMTPRLASLISAREAIGHAKEGDRHMAAKAMLNAERFLGNGTAEDDEPTWLHFWGPADLYCHKARAYLMLGEPKDAERAASAARTDCDEATYPRNHTIYSALRARALIEDGRVDEAIAAATPVVARVSTIGSRRIAAEARATVRLLGKCRSYAPATSFTTWALKLLPAT